MKQFVIKAYDGVGKLDKRMEVRPRHFEGMEKIEVERMNVVIFDKEIIQERI